MKKSNYEKKKKRERTSLAKIPVRYNIENLFLQNHQTSQYCFLLKFFLCLSGLFNYKMYYNDDY